MKIYFLLFIAFLLQEPISSNALLLQAYQSGANVWIIHVLFVVATVLDTVCFYYFGVYIDRKYSQNKMVLYIKKKMNSFADFVGKNGTGIALFLYGPIIFPFSALVVPWIDISFADALVFLFLGDVVFYYAPAWLVVLGVKSFVTSPTLALIAILVVTVVIGLGTKFFQKKFQK